MRDSRERQTERMESLKPEELGEQAQIAQLAFRIYESEGCPEGRAADHWAKAERAIHEQRLPGPATAPVADDGREQKSA